MANIIVLAVSSVESEVKLPCPATEPLCAGSIDEELTCTVSVTSENTALIWKILGNGMESGTIEYNKNDTLMANDQVMLE